MGYLISVRGVRQLSTRRNTIGISVPRLQVRAFQFPRQLPISRTSQDSLFRPNAYPLTWNRYLSTKKGVDPLLVKKKGEPIPIRPVDSKNSLSKQEFLSASGGIIDSLRRRTRWLLLRQNRPYNADEISAFVSWIMMGNFIWIFIGTTTFVGLILFLGNLFVGEDISKKVVRKLVSFDNNLQVDLSAPGFKATWEDGMIKLRNIKIHSNSLNDVQYSFDIDTINMTFSLNKWLEGHGLIEDIDISGLAGEVNFPEDQEFVDNSFDDSYILNSFKLSDMHVMMNGKMFQKPFELNLFTCEMDRLRRPWLVYDFLNANALSGSFNGSLFTLHKRQNRYAHFAAMDDDETESNDPWKKITRVRIDQVDLSNIYTDESKLNWVSSGKAELIVDVMLPNEDSEGQNNLAVSGQTLWQKVKEEAKQLMNSKEERDAALKYVRSKIGKTETAVSPVPTTAVATAPRDKKYVVMDFKVNMYDLKASYPRQLPYSTQTHAPYISDRDLRSLITFINDRKFGLGSASIIQSIDGTAGGDTDVSPFDEDNTFPPLKFRIVQNVQNFKYVDFPSLISLAVPDVDTSKLDEISLLSYKHTNQFVDSFMAEILSLLLLYKEETRLNLIRKYSQRSGMQIFFNNSAVGSLLLVGLGSFVI